MAKREYNITTLKVNKLTQQQYMDALEDGEIHEDSEIYLIPPNEILSNKRGGWVEGGIRASTYGKSATKESNETPQFRNAIIVEAIPTNTTDKTKFLNELIVGDIIYVLE